MTRSQRIEHNLRQWLRLAALVVAVSVTTFAYPVHANPSSDALAKAQAAFDAGKFDEALSAAEAGIAAKKTDGLVFIKARSLYEKGDVQQAWALIQEIQPGRLPSAMQDVFEIEYTKIEAVEKDRARKAKASAAAAPAGGGASGGGGLWKWIVAGVGVAAGGGLTVVGAGAMNEANTAADKGDVATYNDDFDQGQTLWYAGVSLVAVGVGVGVWALLDSGSPAPKEAAGTWLLTPTLTQDRGQFNSGLMLTGRF